MDIAFLLWALIAEVVGTVAGFGSSTVLLPIALLFFDFQTALLWVAVFHLLGNLIKVEFFKASLKWDILLKFGIPSVVMSVVGAGLVAVVPVELLKGLLGLFLMGYVVLVELNGGWKLKPTEKSMVIGGGLSGFLAGLIGTGGALRGAFLSAFRLPKERYIATMAAVALAVDISRIGVYLKQGFGDGLVWTNVVTLAMVAILGVTVGRWLVKKLPEKEFRIIVLLALLVIGIKFVTEVML